ncbi:MAG: hypothetical protein RL616_1541 [Verrucomicrobiota bacterium]
MTSEEEIKLRMGWDATEVIKGAADMILKQEATAKKVVDTWKKAENEKKMISIKASAELDERLRQYEVEQATRNNKAAQLWRERAQKRVDAERQAQTEISNLREKETQDEINQASRRNRARELWRQREAEQIKRHDRDMGTIAAGHTPESWRRQQAINQRHGLNPNSRAGMAGAAGGSAAAGEAVYGLMEGREAGQLSRDVGLAAVAGSASGLLAKVFESIIKSGFKKIGHLANRAVMAGGGTGAIGTVAVGGMAGNVWMGEQLGKMEEDQAGQNDQPLEYFYRRRLNRVLSSLNSRGLIKGQTRENLAKEVSESNFSGLVRIQKQLLDMISEKDKERLRVAEQHAAFAERSFLYEQKRVQLNDQANGIRQAASQIYREGQRVGVTAPNIEQLAGRGYMKKLGDYFGEGGAMDLSTGSGPYARAAQDALFFKNKVTYDLANGLGGFAKDGTLYGQAARDRQLANSAENKLAAAGLETPAMQFRKMNEQLDVLNKNMNDLLKTAKTDGIVIADKPAT